MSFEPGARVQVASLKNRPDLNGRAGSCVEFDAPSGRIRVRLDGEGGVQTFLFKPENLIRFEGAAPLVSEQYPPLLVPEQYQGYMPQEH